MKIISISFGYSWHTDRCMCGWAQEGSKVTVGGCKIAIPI